MFATTTKLKIKAAALFAAAIMALAPQVSAAAPGMELNGKTFNDWTMRCNEATNPDTQAQVVICRAVQQVKNQEGQAVIAVEVGINPQNGDVFGGIIAPLGVILTAGIAVDVDGNAMGAIPYVQCTQQGCAGRFVLSPEQFASWKAGARANIKVVRGDGQPVTLPLSLSGFTAATDALR